MENLTRRLFCCLISLCISASPASCQIQTAYAISQDIQFDPDGQLGVGNISCPDSGRLDIVSIKYTYPEPNCSFTCPILSGSSYPNGTDTVCLNEGNIRRSCYAKNVCLFGENNVKVDRPSHLCPEKNGDMANGSIITYHCVNERNVFDLCEPSNVSVSEETKLIFTTPSVASAAGKISCNCELRSMISNGSFSFLATRQRMAEFTEDDRFYYRIDGHQEIADSPYSQSGYSVVSHQTKKAILDIKSSNSTLSGTSVGFIVLQQGKNLRVQCDGGVSINRNISEPTAQSTTVFKSNYTESAIDNAGTKGYVADRRDYAIYGLSTALGLVMIASILSCLRTAHSVKRKLSQSTSKHTPTLEVNDDAESTTVDGLPTTYQQLLSRSEENEHTDGQISHLDDSHHYARLRPIPEEEAAAVDSVETAANAASTSQRDQSGIEADSTEIEIEKEGDYENI